MYLDSKGSKGLLTAIPRDQCSTIDSKYESCFRCTVVEDGVTDQQASAKHYNKLDRSKVSLIDVH